MKSLSNLPATDQQLINDRFWLMVSSMKTTNGRSATSNRVLIVDNQGIMGAGLENLISGDAALEVLGVATPNEQTLIQEIQRIQPDTIILILESKGISPGRLLDVFADYGRLRIIQVSTDSNVIDVFDRQHIVTQSQESQQFSIWKWG